MVPYRWYSIPVIAILYAVLMLALVPLERLVPGYILLIHPAAGFAAAALLLVGLRAWPGVFLGAYAASLAPGFDFLYQPAGIFTASVATLQAVTAALLTRHFFRASEHQGRETLVTGSSVVGFLLLAAPVACLIPAAATFAPLLPLGSVPGWGELMTHSPGEGWLMIWASNSLGVLIGAPLTLILWPGARAFRQDWGARVALPLLVTAVLVVVGHIALDRYEHRVAQQADARVVDTVLDEGFEPLARAIESLHSVELFFYASDEVTRQEFTVFTSLLLRWPGLHSIEWVPQVAAGERLALETGAVDFTSGRTQLPVQIVEENSSGQRVRAGERNQYYPSLFVEPLSSGADILGFDYGSSPSRRAALELARDSAEAVASERLPLMQTGMLGIPVFIPLYSKHFDPQAATVAQRREALLGFIKGNFEVQNLFAMLAASATAANVQLRLSDLSQGYRPHVLINTLVDENALPVQRDVPFASRTLLVEAWLAPTWRSGASLVSLLFQGFSVLAAFLVALAVLAAAGRNSTAEARVRERTAALRASEQNLEVTLHSIGDAVLVTDSRGRVTRLNQVAEALTGWSGKDALGRKVEEVFSIINEHTRERVSVSVEEVLRTGMIRGLANHTLLIARDGREHAIADSAAPIDGPDGQVQGVVLVFRDVTEERAVARALESSEKRYRQLIEQAPYGILVQAEGKFAYLNPTALALLGAREESQLLGHPILDYLHPDSRAAVARRMEQLNKLGVPAPPLEEQWLRLDGTLLQAEVTAVPHIHEGIRGSLVMLQDIRERKAAESLRDRFFDLSLDPQCVLDKNGYFMRVNAAFCEVLGWHSNELVGAHYRDFAYPDDLTEAFEEEQKIHVDGISHRLELRFLCKGGDWRWLSWSAVSAETDGMIYAVARDITASRDIIEALTTARREAEYANRAKSAFLATMSHEIRTPMNGVIGLVDVLSHTALNEHQAELVDNVRTSSQSLLRLIDDILDFSKIEAGRLELENAPVSIEAIIEGLCHSLLPVAAARGVELCVFVDPAIPEPVLADEVRLRQVFYNLVGNAIKFSGHQDDRPGRVDVRVELASRHPLQLKFTVADNGIGMSKQSLEALFEPFIQGEVSTTRRFGGTGLGLAICKRLMDLMGGAISIDSEEGEGTTAVVTVPFAVAAEQAAVAQFDLQGIRCMVVDSPAINAADLCSYLASAGASAEIIDDLESIASTREHSGDTVVVILDKRAPAHASMPIARLFAAAGDVRYVLITHGRRRRSRQQAGSVVTLDGDALRRHALLRAVAVAAGRASPEVVHHPAAAATTQPAPVSVEDARAAGRLILVAEDDAINRKVIYQQLAILGYAAEIVDDGKKALTAWRQGQFALLLTDLHMPEMDGYSLAQAIRSEEAGKARIPIIALTANALRGEASRAYGVGINDYLVKPVSLERLGALIEHWLARATSPVANSVEDSTVTTEKVIDVEILGDFIGNNPVKVREFLQDYRVAAEQLQAEMHQAARQGDLQQLASYAHRLKSSSRWVGASGLGDLCAELENLGRTGKKAAIGECLSRFDRNHAAVMAAIEHFLKDAE